MADRKIQCTACNRNLGEIRDATLLKGIKYLCPACNMKRVASDMANQNKHMNMDSVPDFLTDIFRGKV